MVIRISFSESKGIWNGHVTVRLAVLGVTLILLAYLPGNLNAQQPQPHFDSTYPIPLASSGTIGGTTPIGKINPDTILHVLVTFPFTNAAGLNAFLGEVQNPRSPVFHHYLSSVQFNSLYSPSASEYGNYMNYFESQGFIVKSYGDHVSLEITGKASLFQSVFHTNILEYSLGYRTYYAPSSQLSMAVNYGPILSVSGLSDRHLGRLSPLYLGSGTGETVLGADFQSAYQLNPLYSKYGYPINATIATILWSGSSNGVTYPPFVPSDISNYTKNYYPASEPQPKIYAYPFGGAPLPGYNAKNDPTGANVESTLDLEMASTIAPGSNVIEVYGSSPTLTCLDTAFANILSPSYNTTVDNLLGNVSVISNSWGTNDTNDSTWMSHEQEAAARGISVFASSGDNGNTPGPDPSFPASMAYNSFGTTSVGGTFTVLSGTSSNNGSLTTGIANQSTWFNLPKAGNGTQGGISQVFNETMWQINSPDANSVITSNATRLHLKDGVGVPDVSAVGANMGICLSTSSGTGLYKVDGTSISSPLIAGLFAVLDHSMPTRVGYANPAIFKLANLQYNGSFSSARPFYFVTQGANAIYTSAFGYNLVNGWGTINASNFLSAYESVYLYVGEVNFKETGLPVGKTWVVNMSGSVRSSTGTNISFNMPYGSYYYSISNSAQIRTYPSTGTVDLGSPMVNISVYFSNSTYNVSFVQKGLSAGSLWSVILNGTTQNSTSTYINFSLHIGNYPFKIPVQSGYSPLQPTGNVTVTDRNLTVQVVFKKAYNLTFSASGLPSGLYWLVKVNNTQKGSSSGTITFPEPNGTYSYVIFAVSGYVPSSSTGTATINGRNVVINVTFYASLNQVQFILNGYPDGSPWMLQINGNNFTSYNTTFILGLNDGSYVFSVSLGTNASRPVYTGTFSLNNSDRIIYINLTKDSRQEILGYIFAITFGSMGASLIGIGLYLSRRRNKIRL